MIFLVKTEAAISLIHDRFCMYLCEKYTGLSLAADLVLRWAIRHTTVLHGIKKIKTDLEKDEQLRSTIDIITKKLNPPK